MPFTDQQPHPAPNPFDSIYTMAFAQMEQGFCLLEKMPTRPSAPPDFRYLLTNLAFDQLLGLHQIVGKTIRQGINQPQVHRLDDLTALPRRDNLLILSTM
ncbi:hypothetical protein [Spirosoma jeollabukense]